MDLIDRIKQYFFPDPLEAKYFKKPHNLIEMRIYNKRTGEEVRKRRVFYTFRRLDEDISQDAIDYILNH